MTLTKGTDLDELGMEIINKLYSDKNLGHEFMQYARNEVNGQATTPADFEAYMITKLGIPQELAHFLATKKDDELHAFVGKHVCEYLW
jgi:hypothetical protein